MRHVVHVVHVDRGHNKLERLVCGKSLALHPVLAPLFHDALHDLHVDRVPEVGRLHLRRRRGIAGSEKSVALRQAAQVDIVRLRVILDLVFVKVLDDVGARVEVVDSRL